MPVEGSDWYAVVLGDHRGLAPLDEFSVYSFAVGMVTNLALTGVPLDSRIGVILIGRLLYGDKTKGCWFRGCFVTFGLFVHQDTSNARIPCVYSQVNTKDGYSTPFSVLGISKTKSERQNSRISSLDSPSVHVYNDTGTLKLIFKLNPSAGQPLYLQVIEQVRYAIETSVLQHGDQLPGIRTLAEQLAVSHNTVAKAYSQLEHEGLLDLRHGSGAYVIATPSTKSQADRIRLAQEKVHSLIDSLKDKDFSEEEIRRLFEAALLHARPLERKSR